MPTYSGQDQFYDDFRRAQAYTTTPGFNGWTIYDSSSGGTPTYLNGSDGAVLTLAATSEAEIVSLYQNNVRAFKLEDLVSVEWVVKVSGINSVTTLVMGVAANQNDTADSVTEHAWFRVEGSASTANLVSETDDATTDNNDKTTGATLSSTFRRLQISFANGLSDVRFLVDGRRRATNSTFDMSAIAADTAVQPFIQLQKASGTGTPAVTVRRCIVTYNYTYVA